MAVPPPTLPPVTQKVAIGDYDSTAHYLKVNADGSINIGSSAAAPLTVQPIGYSFQNITTSTATTVKSGPGVLHLVNVNALGTVASAVTIYDSLTGSGTKIGTINSLSLSGAFTFDVAFATGLTIVTTGAPDITVSFR